MDTDPRATRVEEKYHAYLRYLQGGTRWAEENTKCKRKGVSAQIETVDGMVLQCVNGPTFNKCTNEVGNCGCCHAEIKVLFHLFKARTWKSPCMTMMTTYTPCTNCANAIILSNAIDTLVYLYPTKHDMRGLEMIKDAGIFVSMLHGSVEKEHTS